MDIITEILECCAVNEVKLFSAIYSTLPIDYYIPLISHTFGVRWVFVDTIGRTFGATMIIVEHNATYRRGKKHSYNDKPHRMAFLRNNMTIMEFRHEWYKNGIVVRDGYVAMISFSVRIKTMKIKCIWLAYRPHTPLVKFIEYSENETHSYSDSGSGGYISRTKERRKPPKNTAQIREWMWAKHRLGI